MGKGEIARYEQFLLFPQCFQKACFPGASKGVVVWEWVKEKMLVPSIFSFSRKIFHLFQKEVLFLSYILLSANAFNFDQSKNLLFGKELTLSQTSPDFMCLQYKSFENTVGKGEIAHNEQFLLFPPCFLPF